MDLIEATPAAYRMGAILSISRSVEGLLSQHQASSGGYAFNAALGVMTVHGYPVYVSDHLEMGGAGGQVSALFGNFRRGLILAESEMLIIGDTYEQTRPGAVTFFSEGRAKGSVRDFNAISGLITGA